MSGTIGALLLLVVGIITFLLPSYLARTKRHAGLILAFNLLFGWTLLGWIGALLWALVDMPRAAAPAAQAAAPMPVAAIAPAPIPAPRPAAHSPRRGAGNEAGLFLVATK